MGLLCFAMATGGQARRKPWGREENHNEHTSCTTPGGAVS